MYALVALAQSCANMCNTLSAYHVQRVVLHAMLYEGTAQLLSLTEIKSYLFVGLLLLLLFYDRSHSKISFQFDSYWCSVNFNGSSVFFQNSFLAGVQNLEEDISASFSDLCSSLQLLFCFFGLFVSSCLLISSLFFVCLFFVLRYAHHYNL